MFLKPTADRVLIRKVRGGSVAHRGWSVESFSLPFEAPGNGPLQNPAPLWPKLLTEFRVPFLRRNCRGERHQVEPPAHCLVHCPQARLVISGDEQLELRGKLKKILPHETRCDSVAASQRFQFAFRPATPIFGFHRRNEPGAPQSSKVRRMMLIVGRDERLNWGSSRVFPE